MSTKWDSTSVFDFDSANITTGKARLLEEAWSWRPGPDRRHNHQPKESSKREVSIINVDSLISLIPPQAVAPTTVFVDLCAQWKRNTRILSSITDMVMDPNYLQIIGLGMPVVPLLLRELCTKPDHWFVALQSITRENPVAKEDEGNIKAMAQAWIRWGQNKEYISRTC